MTLVIAGGGTGGHLFPGVAIAEELRARQPDAHVLFVGTSKGIEARVLPGLGWTLETIDISGVKTVGAMGAVRGLLRVPGAILASRKLLKQARASVVVGVGGYASAPVIAAAAMMGIPRAIVENNSVPGLANRLVGRFAARVFIAFDEAARHFPRGRAELVGNPIRRDILARLSAAPARTPGAELSILAFGGSQGAAAVNERVATAVIALAARGVKVKLLHQTGKGDLDATRARYAAAGLDVDVRPFIDDMASAYAAADLVIARSGATTVAELAIAGRPAILVPYPTAADDHQTKNAQALADAGAARVFAQGELTGELLADEIAGLARDPARLATMAQAMRGLARPDAAAHVVSWAIASSAGRQSPETSIKNAS